MPDLPEVTQTFDADVDPYIAALERAKAAAKSFAEANQQVMDSLMGAGLAADEARLMFYSLSNQLAVMSQFAELTVNELRDINNEMAANAAIAHADADALRGVAAALLEVGAAGGAGGGGGGGFGFFGGMVAAAGGWANAIHWAIAGTAELLAVVLPAAVAAASAAFVMYQGVVENVGHTLQGMYTSTEATANMIGKTTGDVLGLGHAFQTAQNQANPAAYALLGSYLDIARSHMVNLAGAGLQVSGALQELAARFDLAASSGKFTSLLSAMVPDLIQLGQIFGNLGHAIANFAGAMPGLAEVLLRIVDAASRLIYYISELPAPLITAFMAFEEFNRWGGLLVGLFGRMGIASVDLSGKWFSMSHTLAVFTGIFQAVPMLIGAVAQGIGGLLSNVDMFDGAIANAGAKMTAFGTGLRAGVLGLSAGAATALAGVAAAAVGVFIAAEMAEHSMSNLTFAIQSTVNAAKNVDVLNTIANSMATVQRATNAANQQFQQGTVNVGRFAIQADHAAAASSNLSTFQQSLAQQFGKVVAGGMDVAKMAGTNLAGGLAIADMAGVKLNQTVDAQGHLTAVAKQQIENLLSGYKAMGQTGGILNNDIAAVNVQLGVQNSKVQQLNSAWDSFMSNAMGLTSTFAGLMTNIQQMQNIQLPATAFSAFSGGAVASVDQVAQSMTSFSGIGAQAWQNYDSALQQAQQYTDALRISATYGGITQRSFAGQTAYAAQQLLPYAKYSATATAELSALVQEAGGPATSNFQTLANWINQNAMTSQQFMQATQGETTAMSNAEKAAQSFSSTLQSQVTTALSAGIVKADNLGQEATQMAQDIQKGATQAASAIANQMLTQLENAGIDAGTAKGLIVAAMTAAGMSVQAATNLVNGLQNSLNAIHSPPPVNVIVTTTYRAVGSPSGPAYSVNVPGAGHPQLAQHGMYVGFQGGGIVGGPSGIDAVHAMLTAGEAVLNARAVAAIGGPLGVHSLNNQPSQAVLTTGGGGGGQGAINLSLRIPVMLNNQQLGQAVHTEQLIYDRRNANPNIHLNRPGRPG